jgi:hypothetical protein
MTCGCCLEVCSQYDEDNYLGPQAIAQVRLFNMHPNGESTRDERLAGSWVTIDVLVLIRSRAVFRITSPDFRNSRFGKIFWLNS